MDNAEKIEERIFEKLDGELETDPLKNRIDTLTRDFNTSYFGLTPPEQPERKAIVYEVIKYYKYLLNKRAVPDKKFIQGH